MLEKITQQDDLCRKEYKNPTTNHCLRALNTNYRYYLKVLGWVVPIGKVFIIDLFCFHIIIWFTTADHVCVL